MKALEIFIGEPLCWAFFYLSLFLDMQNLLILCKMLLRRTDLSATKTERCRNMYVFHYKR